MFSPKPHIDIPAFQFLVLFFQDIFVKFFCAYFEKLFLCIMIKPNRSIVCIHIFRLVFLSLDTFKCQLTNKIHCNERFVCCNRAIKIFCSFCINFE
nr:MAG TPA: hypothetical protein [Caudoviricetes sp.]